MILRPLNWQGIAGLAVAFLMLIMLAVQRLDSVRWKKQSDQFEKLYLQEQAAFATTVANTRAAADAARAADLANAQRVAAEQRTINQRSEDEFEARLADARALAERLRVQPQGAATHRRNGAATPVPGLSAAAGSTGQTAGENRLPDALIATEQAIQLDELIKWVKAQAKVDNDAPSVASSPRK